MSARGFTNHHHKLLGIGNALIDVQWAVNRAFILAQGLAFGAMTLVDEAQSAALQQEMAKMGSGHYLLSSGGSAANTMAGFAALGGHGAFVGKLGNDDYGHEYRKDLLKIGLEDGCGQPHETLPTGRCVVLTTPDSERTMATHLGAASHFIKNDLPTNLIASSNCVYLEGYLFDKPEAKEAFAAAAKIAHQTGQKVAITLSDPFCVNRHRQDFRSFIESQNVDLLFANEEEIKSLFESQDLAGIVSELPKLCPLAVVTRSEKGALVINGNQPIEIKAVKPTRVLDSNGAGDGFAAGFLYGWLNHADLAKSAILGAAVASEIISHYGPRPKNDIKPLLRHLR